MALFEAVELKKTYLDGTRALRGVSFSIEKGEFVAIMGPSGSGKSTLLHILGFLDDYTGGTFRFSDKNADEYASREIAYIRNKKFGFVFQMFNLLPRATVFENVRLPLLYSDIPESSWNDRVARTVESVGLSYRMDHEAFQLSGGEKQRVAIARALVTDPDVVFADEPTGNLDSKSGKMIMEEIQKLHESGRTVILITHETYTAEHAERIISIHDGELIRDEKVGRRRNAHDEFIK